MKIAVATNGNSLEDRVPEMFEESAYLLVVETDDLSYEVYENPEHKGGSGLAMTNKIIEQDCEALISGSIEEPAFEALVKNQITRYLGANYSAKDAIKLMGLYQLELIREYNGKEWDPHAHDHHGTCDCGNQEDE
ncbi:MAG: NifB/NifX family molybdenum-iron cluster-binding protein [Candidatus Dehalobacter alkaniphilus]